jgi:urea-proton symporter
VTFLFFCFCANIIVTSMLLLGGAATVEALTGMKYELASFFIPMGCHSLHSQRGSSGDLFG